MTSSTSSRHGAEPPPAPSTVASATTIAALTDASAGRHNACPRSRGVSGVPRKQYVMLGQRSAQLVRLIAVATPTAPQRAPTSDVPIRTTE